MEGPSVKKRLQSAQTKDKVEKKKTKFVTETDNQFLVYDVLRVIFRYLNGMDLSKASMVCRSWLEAAKHEEATRRGPFCFLGSSHGIGDIHKEQIKSLYIKPTLGLFFQTKNAKAVGCHANILPPNCYTITLYTCGVIYNNKEAKADAPNFVSAFLPKVPNVTVETFTVLRHNHIDNITTMKVFCDNLFKALGKTPFSQRKSKCLLLFYNEQEPDEVAIEVSKYIEAWYGEQIFAICGGVVQDIVVCNPSHGSRSHICAKSAHFVGIVLKGAIKTWSIILDFLHRTEKKVEERLSMFKETVKLQKHSIGFMIACHARGVNIFHKHNVESSIFKKLFPDVPLVGCISGGEFGTNAFRDLNFRFPLYNGQTTVFTILTYGN